MLVGDFRIRNRRVTHLLDKGKIRDPGDSDMDLMAEFQEGLGD